MLFIPEYRRQRVSMLTARLDDSSRKALRNLDGFGNASPFGNQTGNIRARAQIAPIL